MPDKPFSNGWGGRTANLLNAAHNNGRASMSVTLPAINNFPVGTADSVVQYALTPNGATNPQGMGELFKRAR